MDVETYRHLYEIRQQIETINKKADYLIAMIEEVTKEEDEEETQEETEEEEQEEIKPPRPPRRNTEPEIKPMIKKEGTIIKGIEEEDEE